MYSSDSNNASTSIDNALFHATVQLTIPIRSSINQFQPYSDSEEYISNRKSRFNLSSLSITFPKSSQSNRQKLVREPSPQIYTSHLTFVKSNTNMTTTSVKDYLTTDRQSQFSRSISCSSLKNTFVGIFQGLNTDDIQPTPMKKKTFQECIKRTRPRWRAFSKVVAALLTFTQTKKERYEWIQLVGHAGTFKEGTRDGFVLKELNEDERICFERLQNDILKDFIPKYNGTLHDNDGKFYIELEDLLASFQQPCIMDCKIGVRTYLEEELEKSECDPKPRADLYEKMIAIDPSEPTEQEKCDGKLLKPRYMIWRESLSSTKDLGFRIEAIKKSRGLMSKDFQRIKQRNDVKNHFKEFLAHSLARATTYFNRLQELRAACLCSKFIQTHELIGSSILFVHDEQKASLWMIDFGKTRLLPPNIHTSHFQSWIRGSHEDGYLFGLDNLIAIFQEIITELTSL